LSQLLLRQQVFSFGKKTVDMHSTECGRELQYFGVFINKKDARPNLIVKIIIKATGFSF